jgi:phasin
MRAASGEIADILKEACSTNAKGAANYAAKLIEISGTNTSSALEFITHLMGTKSLSEIVQLSATHGRKNLEATSAQNKELWELTQEVAKETAEPMRSLARILQAAP